MAKKKHPNILLIVTDQQNIDTIAAYREHFPDKASGPHHLQTPNLDRLVKNGRSFPIITQCQPCQLPGTGVSIHGTLLDRARSNLQQCRDRQNDPQSGTMAQPKQRLPLSVCRKMACRRRMELSELVRKPENPGIRDDPDRRVCRRRTQ